MKRGILLIALAAVPAFADTVHLRGGGQISGVIVERTEEAVTVDIGGGTITALMASVVRIEEAPSSLQEYRARAAAIPAGDAEAWRELARWAERQTLSSQADEAYAQVVALLPDDQEANRALGLVPVGGRWVTEKESYVARGYVELEGEWVTPAERDRILAERRAREEAERRENEAQVKAIQAEIDAEKRREAAEEERRERRYDNLPEYGDPIPWAWGVGPAYWPSQPLPGSTTGEK